MKNKIVIYTAITGDKDALLPIKEREDCDFVCFTDNKDLQAPGWKIKVITPFHPNLRLSAKPFKILPHYYFPEYTYSIWVDGTFIPKDSLIVNDFVTKFLMNTSIATYIHINSLVTPTTSIFYRDCIYEEAEVCLLHNLDYQMNIINQVQYYRKIGYPKNLGLSACSIIVRKHNDPYLISAMDAWWREVTLRCIRDQISYRYILYTFNIAFTEIDGNIYYDNPYFDYTPHKKTEAHNSKPTYHKWIQSIRKTVRDQKKDLITLCYLWIKKHGMEMPLDEWHNTNKSSEDVVILLEQ
jgi:hypothetical protein